MTGALLLAVCIALAFVRSATHLATVGHPVHLDGFRPEARHWRRLVLPTAGIVGAAAALAVSLPLAMGLAFVTLTGLALREAADWGRGLVPSLGQYGPTAAALGGWLVAWLVAGSQPTDARLDAAWAAACGVLGGAYLLAGVSKVQQAGWAWVRPQHLGLVLLERSHRGAPWQRRARRWMAHQPALCAAGAGLALLIELAGPAFCVPELRLPYAAAAGAMQLGFALLLGFWEIEWLLLLPALALLAA